MIIKFNKEISDCHSASIRLISFENYSHSNENILIDENRVPIFESLGRFRVASHAHPLRVAVHATHTSTVVRLAARLKRLTDQ